MEATSIMQYLGGIQGAGILTYDGKTIGRADYDFDGFLTKGEVMSSGEIRMPSEAMKSVFGRQGLQLMTDNGRLLSLRFTEKKLGLAGDAAHVDVLGQLPAADEWRS
jgi:hypothetical protein